MKKLVVIFLFILIGAGIAWYCSPYRSSIPGIRKNTLTPANYILEKDSVMRERKFLSKQYSSAPAGMRAGILSKAGEVFMKKLNGRFFEYWYETDWDFNGTSEVPGEGSIACGYFVTTLLRDMGVKLDRVKQACSASEAMIKSLTAEKHIQRYSNYSIEKFVEAVKKQGDGIYLTGLDYHTGFVVCEKGKVDFVHSGGGAPARVLREGALQSGLLKSSRYRVTGKITDDKQFLVKWLKGENF